MKLVLVTGIFTMLNIGIICSYGQTHYIHGTIFNADTDKPMEKIKVSVKGTDINTTTNENGEFKLEIPDSITTVTFSEFEGMEIKEIRKSGNNIYNIYLGKISYDLYNLTFEELLQLEVTSASNISEKLSEVAATMIVISKQDILERGYYSLSEMFSDLPGMDIARTYGDQTVFNYWRGFRTAYSQPYIFMIDGMSCNDIFYNQPQIIDNIPMGNIEKVEIVYGPVSAVYGTNAFMGVINVITKKISKIKEKDDISTEINTRINNAGNFIEDIYTNYQNKNFRAALAAKIENTDLTRKLNLHDYYTNKDLLTDTLLWGNLTGYFNKNGNVSIPYSGKSLDFRLGNNNTELGIQVNSMQSGYGMGTPFDRYLPNVLFSREFYYAWFKQDFQLSKKVSSNITICYHSENRKTGDWIEAYNFKNNSSKDMIIQNDTIKPQETTRVIDYSLWPLKNEKISYSQHFIFNLNEKLLLTSGLQIDQTFITKQQGTYGNIFTPNNVSGSNPDFYPQNRTTNLTVWKDYGIYSQVKYSFSDRHIINLCIRLDNNSEYGSSKTFRGGYIMNYSGLTTKILYGQAYQIPTPRTLYSSTTILGSSPDLKPETSETMELNVNYNFKKVSSWISTYYIRNRNMIVFTGNKAKNLAQRKVIGIDAYMTALIPVGFLKKFSLWGYYSIYISAKEDTFNTESIKTGVDDIGDLSHYKAHLGATCYLTKNLILNLRGRFISDRKAVLTNKTSDGKRRIVDGYFTMDGNIMYQNLFIDGFSVALKVENMLDKKYYHPGINKADAGTSAGYWDDKKVWQGSQGWNNSLLPQPHRYLMLSLLFQF